MGVNRIAVRDLVETVERRGDINFRFSARSSAIAGIRGHQRLQKRRGDGYIAEQAVSDVISTAGFELEIHGRVDGYFPATSPLVVDEIKTVRGDAAQIPENISHLHLTQARIYGLLLARDAGVSEVTVRVCYLQLDDDTEVRLEETLCIETLEAVYADLVARYIARVEQQRRWLAHRDSTIDSLPVPFGGFRSGQREMAVSVWRALRDRRRAVIQAPTGIGKTMATLYPAVRALGDGAFDKIFYLTAKGSGQASARDAVAAMKQEGLALIDVTLTAKEKACLNPGAACHPEQCAYAAGYYDRLPGVLSDALAAGESLDTDRIAAIAEDRGMCPFELGLDLATVADVVICDYNYAFDPWVHLRRFFDDRQGQHAFLVDEAHNLVDRGRDMFSAQLEKNTVMTLRKSFRGVAPSVHRALDRLNREVLKLRREQTAPLEEGGYAVVDGFPVSLSRSVRAFCDEAEAWLVERADPALLSFYFEASRFLKTAELVDDNFRCLIEISSKDTRLKIIAVNPSAGLATGFGRAAAAIAFSATLSPQPYFRELIGVGEDASWYGLPSPFPPERLGVFAVTHVGTALRERSQSLDELVDTLGAVIAGRAGHYLIFFPSYQYMNEVHALFRSRFSDIQTTVQASAMSAEARAEFLEAFERSEGGAADRTLAGFVVTGGVFGEGVDLQGERLIGVIVVGVGLPAMSTDRALIGEHFGDGNDPERAFRFAYQYPGINRVLQAAGRVIRSPEDRGVVCLIDRRFGHSGYASLLPANWRMKRVSSRQSLAAAVSAFWNGDACDARPDTLHGSRRDNPVDRPSHRKTGGDASQDTAGCERRPDS